MRIGIDQQALQGAFTGHRMYLTGLMRGFEKIENPHKLIPVNLAHAGLNTPRRFFHDQMELPFSAIFKKLDILFIPAFSVPFIYPGKIVATVHDLTAIDFPDDLPLASRIYWTKIVPYSLKRANHTIAISQYTKDWVVKRLNINPAKISVVYSAYDESFSQQLKKEAIRETAKKYGLPDKYILTVGTLEFKKNHITIIRALAKLTDSPPLVIIGKKGTAWMETKNEIEKLGLCDRVIIKSNVTSEDLPAIYQGASCFVFSSLSEGFGLPNMEAMASGTPVISSNATALPEICGDAAAFFDPNSADDLAEKLKEVLSNEKFRDELIQKGYARVKNFSWEKTAKETLEVFEKI